MVFLFICVILLVMMIIFVFSKIKIEMNNIRFDSQRKRHFNEDYQFIIKWYVLKYIPILKLKITKTKLEKMNVKQKLQKIDFHVLEEDIKLDKKIWKAIKKIKIKIEKMELYIVLGTENASLTAMLVPVISSIWAFLVRKNNKTDNQQIFKIQPVYQNQNLVNISISGIFEIKMSHIINSIYVLNKKEKKGVKEYERTSDRRSYDYSYE